MATNSVATPEARAALIVGELVMVTVCGRRFTLSSRCTS